MKKKIIEKWQRSMGLDAFLRKACASCSALKCTTSLKLTHPDEINLSLLRNDDLPRHLLPLSYNLSAYDEAILEPSALDNPQSRGPLRICTKCLSDLKKGEMPRLALCNWLYYARERLPPQVKLAFDTISIFEKAMICRVRTNSILCRFSGFDLDERSYFSAKSRHIRGNIISTPLNVPKLNQVLPPSPTAIRDTICAILVSNLTPTDSKLKDLHPVLVRKSKVKLMIEFLLANNPHYQVSTAFQGFSTGNLDSLFEGPDDIGIPASARIGHLPVNNTVDSIMADYTDRHEGLDGIFMENVAYTLGDHSASSYREMTMDALSWCKSGNPFIHTRPGSSPVPDINNPNWLSWAHPNADPFGIGGFNDQRRRRRISPESQLRHLLNVRDPFFETEFEVAFNIYNIIRKAAVNTTLRFSVPIHAYKKLVSDIKLINQSELEVLRLKFQRDPSYEPVSENERTIIRLMSSISPVARGIPGTVSQRIRMQNEIRGIINQKGSPTLFVTVNPADHHNPLVAVLAKRPDRCMLDTTIDELCLKDRMMISLKHPAVCAQFFDIMIRSFVRIVLRAARGNKQPRGIFGYCDSYYGTIETQGRGSLHCHMLLWLRGHLPPGELAEQLASSNVYRNRLTRWLDSITDSGFQGTRSALNNPCDLDHEELSSNSIHPGTVTGPLISQMDEAEFDKEMKEHVDELLVKYNWHRHTGTCWKYLQPGEPRMPSNCRFGLDGSTNQTMKFDSDTGTIRQRRRHLRMTLFNPIIIFLLKCNTDIKFIGSGEEAKAFMYYATDYITKLPLSVYAGLSAISDALRQYDIRGLTLDSGDLEADARKAMTVAVNSMLGHQEFSHPQIMSFLVGGGEHYSNETFQPINWAEIVSYVVNHFDVDNIGSSPTMRNLVVSVTPERKTLSASNHLLDYMLRPLSEPFQDMGLYKHIAWTFKSSVSKSRQSRNKSARFTSSKHPQYSTHSLKVRRSPAIPVLLGPKIHRRHAGQGELELWARDMTILFKPWRNPKDIGPLIKGSWLKTLDTYMVNIPPWERIVINNLSLLAEAKHTRDERPRGNRRNKLPPALIDAEFAQEFASQRGVETIETNIFDLSVQDDEETTSHPSALNLENVLGKEANEIFGICFSRHPANIDIGTSQTSESLGQHTLASSSMSETTEKHKAHMSMCKSKLQPDNQDQTPKREQHHVEDGSSPNERRHDFKMHTIGHSEPRKPMGHRQRDHSGKKLE
jgi:hypothetical protein